MGDVARKRSSCQDNCWVWRLPESCRRCIRRAGGDHSRRDHVLTSTSAQLCYDVTPERVTTVEEAQYNNCMDADDVGDLDQALLEEQRERREGLFGEEMVDGGGGLRRRGDHGAARNEAEDIVPGL